MNIIHLDRRTANNPYPCQCGCGCGNGRESIGGKDGRPIRKSALRFGTLLLPVSRIGGRSGIDHGMAALKEMSGVTGASLVFGQTALRILYDPDLISAEAIEASLSRSEEGKLHFLPWKNALRCLR